ncbi:MAG: hypothetical protein AAF636_17185 [Pseudomonadota bacterium]
MWPRSAQNLYTGLEPPSSHSSDQNFDFFYVRMLERITACLEFRLSHRFETDERLFPAVLVFNPSEDPLWCDLRRGYGTGQTKHAVKLLEDAQRRLATIPVRMKSNQKAGITEIYQGLADLPRPASLWLDNAYEEGREKFAQTVEYLLSLYTGQLEEARKWGGNARAKRIAIRLRAITEFYTSHTVNVGRNSQFPHGTFVECLSEMYEVIGMQVHFYRYASLACSIPGEHEELQASFKYLRSIPSLID